VTGVKVSATAPCRDEYLLGHVLSLMLVAQGARRQRIHQRRYIAIDSLEVAVHPCDKVAAELRVVEARVSNRSRTRPQCHLLVPSRLCLDCSCHQRGGHAQSPTGSAHTVTSST